jgi:outer membrane protein assembly factor BamB
MRTTSFPTSRAAATLGILLAALFAIAGDWPQFLGPERNGISTETGLSTTWPKEGPPVLWEKEVGEGYSGPVIAGNQLILLHRIDNQEVLSCYRADTGRENWKFPYPSQYQDQYGKGDGPRSTPLIAAGRVYTLGAEGQLHCVDLETGKKVWDRSLNAEYKVLQGFFGVATSPVLEGGLLLVNVGSKDAGIVAFDKDTGKEIWRATDHEASYSSPIVATLDGVRQAIFLTREGIVFLDPRNGSVNYSKHWRSRNPASANAATPLVVDDQLFFSASYQTGAILLRAHKDRVEEVWKGDEVMSNHYNTCIHHKGYLYGFEGRQEFGPRLRCVELKSGKVAWTSDRAGCGSMVLAEGNLFILGEDGDLAVVEATPDGYKEKARVSLLGQPCRSQIALANGRLYARDAKKLVCLSLRK